MKCYRCNRELPTAGSACPSCGQAIFTRFTKGEVSMGRRLDGCLPETPSVKDYRATPNLSNLPKQVDLREWCSPVEDQGRIGSCTANAAVGALEFQHRRDGKPAVDLSRMFVYFNARRMAGSQNVDSGATISSGMAALLAFGAPPESAWPYNPDLIDKTPDAPVYQQALPNTPVEYARVDGLEHVQGALAQKHPVVFASSLPQRCFLEAAKDGVCPTPTKTEVDEARTVLGTHAMLLVGYDLNDGVMLVRNSWGTGWGQRGYFRLPIETFTATLAANTTWILGKLEESGAFTVVRPAVKAPEPVAGGVKDQAAKLRDEIRGSVGKDIADALKDIRNRVNPPRQG